MKGDFAFKDTFKNKVLKKDCFFLFRVSTVCVLFQLAKTLIFPSLGSANISEYIFILIKMAGQVSEFHRVQGLQRSPFRKGDTTFHFAHVPMFLKGFSHLLRVYLAVHQVESCLWRKGLGWPSLLGCLWKRLRKFLCRSDSGLSPGKLRELGWPRCCQRDLKFSDSQVVVSLSGGFPRANPKDKLAGH